MRLSDNFLLSELTVTAHRGIDNEPPPAAVERLRALAVTLLQPLRDRFGPLVVTSGYRSVPLNSLIGGSPTSAHPHGCAADLVPVADGVTVEDMARWLDLESGLDFDQVIAERDGYRVWLHVALPKPGRRARRQALTWDGRAYAAAPWRT
jgi:zinc D-Ala-D-Ala carboxypeptidase